VPGSAGFSIIRIRIGLGMLVQQEYLYGLLFVTATLGEYYMPTRVEPL
jgi:hypothetical protein